MPTEDESPPPEGIRARLPELYAELRAIAAQRIAKLPPQTLTPDDLLHEAFLKLAREEARRRAQQRSELADKSEALFYACFGAACRDVLVDRARRKATPKHGGDRRREDLHTRIALAPGLEFGVLEMEDALQSLETLDPQLAQLVEHRIFGGMSIAECAEALGLSPRTVNRRWAFAIAWLHDQLG